MLEIVRGFFYGRKTVFFLIKFFLKTEPTTRFLSLHLRLTIIQRDE
jgi:hypothetical protein